MGGVYSYIHVLPDGFLLNLSWFQKKSVGHNTNTWIDTPQLSFTLRPWREASARFLTQCGVEPGGGWYKLYLKNTIQKTTYDTIHLVWQFSTSITVYWYILQWNVKLFHRLNLSLQMEQISCLWYRYREKSSLAFIFVRGFSRFYFRGISFRLARALHRQRC